MPRTLADIKGLTLPVPEKKPITDCPFVPGDKVKLPPKEEGGDTREGIVFGLFICEEEDKDYIAITVGDAKTKIARSGWSLIELIPV